MNYIPHNFKKGQVLKAEYLNKIEEAIVEIEKKIVPNPIWRGDGNPPINGEQIIGFNYDKKEIFLKNLNEMNPKWEKIVPSYFPESLDMVLYTEFKEENGWFSEDGELFVNYNNGTNSMLSKHSQLLRIEPFKTYYLGYRHDPTLITCSGYFFDKFKQKIGPLLTQNLQEFTDYLAADGEQSFINGSNFDKNDNVKLYRFDAPKDAYYFSYNLSKLEEDNYRQYICSKPVFINSNSGNYIIREGEPLYQSKKGKSLCVIGASGVAYNREFIEKEAVNKYFIGFQEYLLPWYNKVDSYGYAGKGYIKGSGGIYTNIIKKDLSQYDEFLLIPSTSQVEPKGTYYVKNDDGSYKSVTNSSGTVGNYNSTSETYFGGLNAIIERIYSQNPKAKIFLSNASKKSGYSDLQEVGGQKLPSKKKLIIDQINAGLKELSQNSSCQLIDVANTGYVHEKTSNLLTYDGTHLNIEGNKLQGLSYRKEMLGF